MPSAPRHRSGGPRTPEGKARSALNATTHGLRSSRIVLQDEDPREFEAHAAQFRDCFAPVGPVEAFLVDQIIFATWRIARVRRVESATMDKIYADTVPVGEGLPQDAREQRALISTLCNDLIDLVHRYGTARERQLFRAHRELLTLRASRENGVTLIPGACRISVVAPAQASSTPAVDQ